MDYLAKEDIIQKNGGAHVFGRIVDFDHVFQTVGQLPEESVTPAAQAELLKVFRAWKQG